MPSVPEATLTGWKAVGTKSQQVAAYLAAWAARQPAHTIVPAADVVISRLPTVTNPVNRLPAPNNVACVGRAVRLLADHGLLYRDPDTGHYHVSQLGHRGLRSDDRQ